MAPLILALDQQLPSLKSQQTPPLPLHIVCIRSIPPKHLQANLCSFPTNVDNSQHFHFIMAQRGHAKWPKGYAALLGCSAGRLPSPPSPQVVCVALGALFKILLCKFYYFYMINRKIPMLEKGTKYKQEFHQQRSPGRPPSSYPSPHFLTSQLGAHFWHFYESLTL